MSRLTWLGVVGFLAGGSAWAAGTSVWQNVACVPADPPVEALYKTLSSVDDFERDGLAWQAVRSSQNAAATLSRDTAERHSGSAALRVAGKPRAAFDLMGNALPLSDTLAVSVDPVYLSGSGLFLEAR